MIKVFIKNNKNKIMILFLCIISAIIAHAFPIYQMIKNDVLFTGPNDGISQMLPFQSYIYEQYTKGNYFYSTDFGLGGDFFSDLSYYYWFCCKVKKYS